jgi:hypothetical protein
MGRLLADNGAYSYLNENNYQLPVGFYVGWLLVIRSRVPDRL